MDKREELLSLLEKDPFNLLEFEKTEKFQDNSNDVLKNNFEEIVDFLESKGHEPTSNLDDIRIPVILSIKKDSVHPTDGKGTNAIGLLRIADNRKGANS